MDESARQLELVRLTCRNGLRNCVHWSSERLILRVLNDAALLKLSTLAIVDLLIAWVRQGGEVRSVAASGGDSQVPYDHLFDVVIPVTRIPQGLYLKIALCVDDGDYSEVMIVSCHAASHRRES